MALDYEDAISKNLGAALLTPIISMSLPVRAGAYTQKNIDHSSIVPREQHHATNWSRIRLIATGRRNDS
jgi:hypothetical protein